MGGRARGKQACGAQYIDLRVATEAAVARDIRRHGQPLYLNGQTTWPSPTRATLTGPFARGHEDDLRPSNAPTRPRDPGRRAGGGETCGCHSGTHVGHGMGRGKRIRIHALPCSHTRHRPLMHTYSLQSPCSSQMHGGSSRFGGGGGHWPNAPSLSLTSSDTAKL